MASYKVMRHVRVVLLCQLVAHISAFLPSKYKMYEMQQQEMAQQQQMGQQQMGQQQMGQQQMGRRQMGQQQMGRQQMGQQPRGRPIPGLEHADMQDLMQRSMDMGAPLGPGVARALRTAGMNDESMFGDDANLMSAGGSEYDMDMGAGEAMNMGGNTNMGQGTATNMGPGGANGMGMDGMDMQNDGMDMQNDGMDMQKEMENEEKMKQEFMKEEMGGAFGQQQRLPNVGVRHYNIQLNQKPEQRWRKVAIDYKPSIIEQVQKSLPALAQAGVQMQPFSQVSFDREYERELAGIAHYVGHPAVTVDSLKLLNMVYEMTTDEKDEDAKGKGCSDVVWTSANGTVMHGRNLDDFGEDAKSVNWAGMTFEATFRRGKRIIAKTTMWPGTTGIMTGMRFPDKHGGGYSFAQNTRYPNDAVQNLQAAAKGGQPFQFAARRILESTSNYQTAMKLFYSTSFMAPQYFILAGAKPGEGSVLTIDRLAQHSMNTPPIQHLGTDPQNWYLVQTNDDMTAEPLDDRRPGALDLIQESYNQASANENTMAKLMSSEPLMNEATLYSTVMVPSTGYYKTLLPGDMEQNPMEGDDMEMMGMGGQGEEMGMMGGMSLTQQKVQKKWITTPQLDRLKQAKSSKILLNNRQLQPIGHAKPHVPADEVSFMQSSFNVVHAEL
jgi:hypothetical protein